MRTNVCTLVALDTVFFNPFRHECSNAAFFRACGALLPCAVGDSSEVAHLEAVAVLSVDGAHEVFDEGVFVFACLFFYGEVAPCGVHIEFGVFAASVNSCVVFVNHVLTFLAVALDDEFFHLFYGEVYGYNFSDAEECALENCVGAVAESDFLSDFCCVNVVYGDVVVGEVFFDLVGEVLCEFLAFPDCVQQECAAVAETACHIVQVQVRLNVTCHEAGCGHQVCGTDGVIAKTEVGAGEAAAFL